MTEFLLWHPANPDSVTACVARARENLRGVREQISSEMWEHLNRLHLLVARTRHARVLEAPHEFLVRVREGSHAFQGVTKATLSRGEAFEFLELGAHLERADTTARVLLTSMPRLVDGPGDRLASLLRSCGGFEAFRRHESEEVQGERVVEFLLLERSFPRSVLFCAERCLEAVRVDLRLLAAAGTLARDARREAHLHGRASARSSLARTRCSARCSRGSTRSAASSVARTSRRASSCPAPTPSMQQQQ